MLFLPSVVFGWTFMMLVISVLWVSFLNWWKSDIRMPWYSMWSIQTEWFSALEASRQYTDFCKNAWDRLSPQTWRSSAMAIVKAWFWAHLFDYWRHCKSWFGIRKLWKEISELVKISLHFSCNRWQVSLKFVY